MPSFIALLLILLVALPVESAPHTTVRYFQADPRYNYVIELLRLILDETRGNYGDYRLMPVKNTNYRRGTALLAQGQQIDIMVSAPSQSLLEQLNPILIPIEQGLLGYRLFFIRRGDTDRFAQITSLKELNQHFVAGFGAGWVDRQILEANAVPMVVHPEYKLLYKMLIGGRFDYFPRGVNEIQTEFERFGSQYPELAIETRLAFYYPYPRYFFVNRDNQALWQRIESGFRAIQNNGRFQAHFEKHHASTLQRIRTEKRRIFPLRNPLLPQGVPLPDTGSWLPRELLAAPQSPSQSRNPQ